MLSDLSQKKELVTGLCESGLKDIELGSFVRPDAIPQLKDTAQLFSELLEWKNQNYSDCRFWAFVPNMKGLEKARDYQKLFPVICRTLLRYTGGV